MSANFLLFLYQLTLQCVLPLNHKTGSLGTPPFLSITFWREWHKNYGSDWQIKVVLKSISFFSKSPWKCLHSFSLWVHYLLYVIHVKDSQGALFSFMTVVWSLSILCFFWMHSLTQCARCYFTLHVVILLNSRSPFAISPGSR